jgi:hypothetical protein
MEPEKVVNESTAPHAIKKRTHKEIAIITGQSRPWKSRIRRSTFLPMIPRPGFGNIIHFKKRLSHKLKR